MTAQLTPGIRGSLLVAFCLLLLAGIFLRLPPSLFFRKSGALRSVAIVHPNPKWSEMRLIGPDEGLYRDYTIQLGDAGFAHYRQIIAAYIGRQNDSPSAILPPTRVFYVSAGALWQAIFRSDALTCLRDVASLFSVLTLALAAIVAWRMFGVGAMFATTALVAFAPTQLHMSQHAMIDGVFTFWTVITLGLLWQNLQTSNAWGWLGAYTVSLALLVTTKETAFFVWSAFIILLLANRWVGFGRVSCELVIATFVGPLIGLLILTVLAGGVTPLVTAYQLFITKNYSSDYIIRTMDGPWQRYLVDLLLVSPIIVLLTLVAFLRNDSPAVRFLAIFLAVTYVLMCNVPYGLNLRFVNFWDVPLRLLAVAGLSALIAPFQQRRALIFTLAIAFLCVLELRQYQTLFVDHALHELTSDGLLRALDILK